ncbi:MAG: chemotaxis protein CheA [Deltaproteobacteria bacterium]|nr:chemotaxis protein CheA [Deltaproteobacteria bacterium]NCP02799.1 chemotaxis protein CheA [Deltaproteobacteria bacterium]
MDMTKYKAMFLSESREHLQKMATLLVEIEANPQNSASLDALFREAHSIKGMAASMGYQQTANLAHQLEDSLDHFRQLGQIDSATIDRLLAGTDLLARLLEDIHADRTERSTAAFLAVPIAAATQAAPIAAPISAATLPQTSEQQIRLSLHESIAAPGARLLVLLKQLESLGQILACQPEKNRILSGGNYRKLDVRLKTSVTGAEIKERLKVYSEISQLDIQEPKPPTALGAAMAGSTTVRIPTELLDRFIHLTGELMTNRYMLHSAAQQKNWLSLNEGLGQLARLVKNLHHQVLKVRMMPVETVTARLPRLVRDLARTSNKEIHLELEGSGIELDRAILEELTDPLVHMVRNAVDHGIEHRGTIVVRAWRQRDQVMLQVADNGRGMDPQALRRQAVNKGLITPAQAQIMRDYESFQLVCLPGFSTAPQVTATSGRGVGMDVVKAAVEKLGGVLHIESAPQQGTRMTLKLPLSVAILKALLVRVDEKLVAIPLTRVLQTLEIDSAQIQMSGKHRVFSHHEELLPLVSLRKILDLPNPQAALQISVVLTEAFGRKVGLVVDGFAGQREVFVQSLPAPLDHLKGLGGGTILGDGSIVFLLDIQGILERRRGGEPKV